MAIKYEIASKGDSKFLKKVNEARILNMIRHQEDISRVEISKRAKMSKAGVSEIITRLISNKFISEKGKGLSTNRGGKRPTILEINSAGGFVFGIHIERTRGHIVIADITGTIIDQKILEYPISDAIDSALPEICRFMDMLIEKNNLKLDRLISIAIAVPGLVDRQKGDLIIAATEGWAHKPFIEVFQSYFDVPVILENDVNALSLAEFYFGAGQEHSDMICLHFGDGIGAGIIENDELVRGVYGGAGEIGYMKYTPCTNEEEQYFLLHGQKHYGKILGITNMTASLNTACKNNNYPLNGKIEEKKFYDFVSTADPTHPLIKSYFTQFAKIVSELSANMIIMLNPCIFVFSGELFYRSEELSQLVLKQTRLILDETPLKNMTELKIGALRSGEILKGVVEIALSLLYKPNLSKSFMKE